MPPLVMLDARDAHAPQLRGWGRYARCLLDALGTMVREGAGAGFQLQALTEGGAGPEVLFEQVKLPVALVRSRAALVHAPNCFLPLLAPCPGVVTIHDLAFEHWRSDFARVTGVKYRALTPLAARRAARVICDSAFTREDVCERYRVDRGKVRVIPLAPALPLGDLAPPRGPYVLGVGDLRRKKNLGALVDAFTQLRRTRGIPHRLVLAGVDCGEGPRLRARAGGEPLELTGYVSDARLDALIRGADVLVHPSLYEGFGLVIVEAMIRETPVVAARASALPEAGGDAALYFEPGPDGGSADLARVLGALLMDAQARSVLARRGLEWVRRYSWERTARETAAVYRELL
ncbi:MAG: glycosyltransferase family 4 protein [Solirubrobacteraceae bacterium]